MEPYRASVNQCLRVIKTYLVLSFRLHFLGALKRGFGFCFAYIVRMVSFIHYYAQIIALYFDYSAVGGEEFHLSVRILWVLSDTYNPIGSSGNKRHMVFQDAYLALQGRKDHLIDISVVFCAAGGD
jgi:hypothetical protein